MLQAQTGSGRSADDLYTMRSHSEREGDSLGADSPPIRALVAVQETLHALARPQYCSCNEQLSWKDQTSPRVLQVN